MLCFLALVVQIKLQKLLTECSSEYGYTEVIRALRKVHIVNMKVKNSEHLVRTEVHGAAAVAFNAVGARVPDRVQTINRKEQLPQKGNCGGAFKFRVLEPLRSKGSN